MYPSDASFGTLYFDFSVAEGVPMKKTRLFQFIAGLAVLAAQQVCFAQTSPTADVLNPRADVGDPTRTDVPTLRSDITLPQVQFIFDQVLDPNRISLLEAVGNTSVNDPRLTAGARSVILNHLAAMQQVELAIRFLQANRSDILAGNSTPFNQVFGNIGLTREVAIINPNPIAQNATLVRLATGATTGYISLTIQNPAGGGNTATSGSASNVLGSLRAGDFIYIVPRTNLSDPTAPVDVSTLGGVIARVFLVQRSTGTGAAQQPTILLDPNTAPIPTTSLGGQTSNLQVYRVNRLEQRTDSTRYDQVLATFQSIRTSLAGLDPDLPALGQISSTLNYNRGFRDINQVWAPGVASFTGLDGVINQFANTRVTGLTSTLGADRLVRQAGFSTSDSYFHHDRVEDRGNNILLDRLGNQTTPLLWTEDNTLPLTFNTRVTVPGSTNDDRAFFRDRQTIFSEPDDVFTQYLGRAFFEETIRHAGDFFDELSFGIDLASNLQLIRDARSPAGGAFQTTLVATPAGNVLLRDQELADVPESGNAIISDTTLRKWQMIIESFAEFDTDLTRFDVAAIGIAAINGGVAPGDLAAKDATNYALFAGLLSGTDVGSIDVSRIEPFGKRADGGFNPVVPRN